MKRVVGLFATLAIVAGFAMPVDAQSHIAKKHHRAKPAHRQYIASIGRFSDLRTVIAATQYPSPTFSQSLAGITTGGLGLLSIGCTPNTDGVTCALQTAGAVGGTVSGTFVIVPPFGVSSVLALSGQSTCAVVVPTGTYTGLSIIPQISSDGGTTWVTATSIGGGNITAAGTYGGSVGGNSPNAFRLNASLGTGTVTVSFNCSSAISSQQTGQGTPGAPVGGVSSVQIPNVTGSSVLAAAGANLALAIGSGQATCSIGVSNLANETLQVQETFDGTTWFTNNAFGNYGTITASGGYKGACAAAQQIRVIVTTFVAGGTANVTLNASSGPNAYGAYRNSSGPASAVASDTGVLLAALTVGANNVLIAGNATSSIYVTGWNFTITGTTPTYQFRYAATGTACATGSVTLTGVYSPTVGTPQTYGGAIGTILTPIPPNNDLCVTLGGTTPFMGGVLSYARY